MFKAIGLKAALAAALLTPIDAWKLELPKATKVVALLETAWTPKPTSPPVIKNLFARQYSFDDDQSILVAPDRTCGYVSGIQVSHYTCVGDYTCAMVTASGPRTGNVACCNTEICNARTACVDYNQIYNSTGCDDSCSLDAFILKCINSDMPYCNTVSFANDIYDFWCNSIDIRTAEEVLTTYLGQTNHRFATLPLSGEATFSATGTSSARGPSVSGASSRTQAGAPEESGSSNGSNGNSNNSYSGQNGGGSSTPIGAIIGGVVGGIGALAIAGLIIWLVLRNKKKKKKQAAATGANQQPPHVAYAPVQQGLGPQDPNQPNAGLYDPKYVVAGQPYPPQNQQFPSQDQQYPPHNQHYPSGGYYHQGNVSPTAPTSSTSPTMSNLAPFSDPRVSQMTATSPTPSQHAYAQPGYQQGGPVIHEAPAGPEETNRGGLHELA